MAIYVAVLASRFTVPSTPALVTVLSKYHSTLINKHCMHIQNCMCSYICIFLVKVKRTVTEVAADQNQMITPEHTPMSVSF